MSAPDQSLYTNVLLYFRLLCGSGAAAAMSGSVCSHQKNNKHKRVSCVYFEHGWNGHQFIIYNKGASSLSLCVRRAGVWCTAAAATSPRIYKSTTRCAVPRQRFSSRSISIVIIIIFPRGRRARCLWWSLRIYV